MKIANIALVFFILNTSIILGAPTSKENYENKAIKALERIIEEKVEEIYDKSNNTGSQNEENIKEFVLSTHIRSFSDIPESIDAEIIQVKESVKQLIRVVATDIELSNGYSGSLEIDQNGNIIYKPKENIPGELNKKREKLLKANLANTVSIRSASLAFHLLSNINKSLRKQAIEAEKTNNRNLMEKAFMKQAIYVYEIADLTLDLLNSTTLEGKVEIMSIRDQTTQRTKERIEDIEQQIKNAKEFYDKDMLSAEELNHEIKTNKKLKEANEISLSSWKEFMDLLEKQDNFLEKIKNMGELIKYKRDKAKIQIETLRDLRQIAELKDVIGTLDELVSSVASLDLLILDEKRVEILLGYDIER